MAVGVESEALRRTGPRLPGRRQVSVSVRVVSGRFEYPFPTAQ